jgi:hypothetical protein
MVKFLRSLHPLPVSRYEHLISFTTLLVVWYHDFQWYMIHVVLAPLHELREHTADLCAFSWRLSSLFVIGSVAHLHTGTDIGLGPLGPRPKVWQKTLYSIFNFL